MKPKKNSCPVMYPDTQDFRNGKLFGYDEAIDDYDKHLPSSIEIGQILRTNKIKTWEEIAEIIHKRINE